VTERDWESAIPPELLEEFEQQQRRMQEFWSNLAPIFEARTMALAAAIQQMQPALEAARAAGQALEAAQAAFERLPDLGTTLVDGLRRAFPPNWDAAGVRLRSVRAMVADDGIPIVWVPRGAVVSALMAAGTRDERLRILGAHDAEIISDCDVCLADCSAPELSEEAALTQRVLDAYTAGLYEPAQALAIILAERIITNHVAGGPGRGSYDRAKKEAEFRGSMMLAELRRGAAIAPVVRFYAEWYPSSGQPPPSELSRHVSVHHPNLQQYSRSNALLALMLLVSLLREVAEWMAPESDTA
jgi:hypothetical protein